MPFIFISIFYSVIAKTLLKTKEVIYSPNSSLCSSKNEERQLMNNNNRNNREIFSDNNITNQDKKSRKQLQARHKLAKIVLFLSLAFFICWLPKQIHDLYWYNFNLLLTNSSFMCILGLLVYLFIHHVGIIFGK